MRPLVIHIHILVLIVGGILHVAAVAEANSHREGITPWESIEGNARWRVDDLTGRTPPGSPTTWREEHQAWGFSSHTVAYTGQPLQQAHAAVTTFANDGLLDWEMALLAANVAHQTIRADLGRSWIEFLQNWSSLSEAQRVQIQLSLRLRLIGGAFSSLSPSCLPSDLHTADTLIELAYLEQEVPGRRLRSRIEPPPQLPEDALQAALQGPERWAVEGALSLLALTSPSAMIIAKWAPQSATDSPRCLTRYVADFISLVTDPSQPGSALFSSLIERTSQPIETRWLWRFALHRYVMGDTDAVQHIATYFQEQHRDQPSGRYFMQVLAATATGGSAPQPRGWPEATDGGNPTFQWVAAESARMRGDVPQAERALASIVDADVHFVVAWLSLIAARAQLQRGHDAFLALQTLQEIAPPLPIYDHWIATYQQRLVP